MIDARELLRGKRDGREMSESEIEAFLRGYCAGELPDHLASALLMAIYVHGMGAQELFHWTRAMLSTGARLELGGVAGPKADKHSTGGVGDKVSIPLAPAAAACGLYVPMVSGRGLGHTGGTLDKLESIPGMRVELSLAELRAQLERLGLAFGAQTAELVPADRKLYALRDATGLVESIPLIASSILSKKLAEDLDALVLDVKYGSGAFLPERGRGAELARTMVELAARFGLPARAFQTSMERPLGLTVGHALEVEECLECLRGGGPPELRELVVLFGGEMLHAGGLAADTERGGAAIERALDGGAALERFARVVAAQGGAAAVVLGERRLERAPDVERVRAGADGFLDVRDCRRVGRAVAALGGGRRTLGEAIDPAVGLRWLRDFGEEVRAGEEIAELHHRGGRGLGAALEELAAAVHVGAPLERGPLVAARFE